MPELPEVETVRRTLAPHLLGRWIRTVAVPHPHVLGGVAPRVFAASLRKRRIGGLARRGKYLVFDLEASDGGGLLHLIVHLRMTGRLAFVPARVPFTPDPRHTHAWLGLDGGGRLIFHDVRKFGRLGLAAPADLARCLPVGHDPVLEGIDGPLLLRRFGTRRAPLKSLLLRQDLLCGLGNIYADEALHRAGLHPLRAGVDLGAADAERLACAIAEVLAQALAFQGTTLWDYRTGDGERGSFGRFLRVYGRVGLPCRGCGTPVASLRIAGRTSAFCPRCQSGAGDPTRPVAAEVG